MKTVDMEIYRNKKDENEQLRSEMIELKKVNRDLEERLQELYSAYMWLYYQLEGMPTQTEVLKARQEMQALMKQARSGGCHCKNYD